MLRWPVGAALSVSPSGKVTTGSHTFSLSWDAATGGTGTVHYNLVRVVNGTPTTIVSGGTGTTKSDTFTVTQGAAIYYYVVAYDDVDITGNLTSDTITGNSAPYWPSGAAVSVSPNGIVTEGSHTFSASWTAAIDPNGDTKYYDVYRIVNGVSTQIATGQTGTSKSDTFTVGQGDSIRYRVRVRDASIYASSDLYSAYVNGNAITPAVLSSAATIDFDTTAIAFTRNDATNSNGNASFTYTLGLTGITVYNPDVSAAGQSFNVSVWRSGGYPAGPYIKFADIKTYLASGQYHGTLDFSLTSANIYGSTAATTKGIATDLRKTPTGLGNVAYSGGYTINTVLRYLPDQRAITVTWDAATDPLLGAGITYAVYYRVHGTTPWTLAEAGLTAATYALTPPSGDTQIAYDVKVVASSSYGTSAEASGATLNIDKYLRPVLALMSRKRNATSVDVTLLVTLRASFTTALTVFTYTKVGGSTVGLTLSNLNPTYNYSEGGVLVSSTSYTMVGSIQDDAGTVIGSAAVTVDIPVPSYIPKLSVRKLGIGIDIIPGGSYALEVGGTINCTGVYKNGVEVTGGGGGGATEAELFMALRRMRRFE